MKYQRPNHRRPKVGVLASEENHCVWMKAGVVNLKLCNNAYDCLSCAFDKAMMRSARREEGKITSWRKAMSEKPYSEKECRHMLTGRVQYHLCSNGYRCNVCEFDQSLDEADLAMIRGRVYLHSEAGFLAADNYYYHRGHTWARIEHGGLVRIGIDDFAARLIGKFTEIRLPALGAHLEQTRPGMIVQRDTNPASLLSPMDGIVLAANSKVLQHPEEARKDPYGDGWLLVMEPRGLKENLKNLLYEEEVAAWLKAERHKLDAIASDAYGMPLAATGGEMVEDIFGSLSHHVSWKDLIHEFLMT